MFLFLTEITDKPTHLSIGSIAVDQVIVNWKYDNTTNPVPPLYYRVTYLPVDGVGNTAKVEYQEGKLEYSITLTNLKPSTLYEISISSMTSNLSSDSVKLVLQTAEGNNGN